MSEELADMPIWQDHERRITTLENTFSSLSHEMKEMRGSVDETKNTIKESNIEQKELLNTLITHHLETDKMKISNFWKVVLNVTGAGGLLASVIYAVSKLIG